MSTQALKSQACTCNIRMSNRPTKSVTDIMRLKTVLSKSVEVLQNISTNSQPFLQDQVDNKSLKSRTYAEYWRTVSSKSDFNSFFRFSYSEIGKGWVRAHLYNNSRKQGEWMSQLYWASFSGLFSYLLDKYVKKDKQSGHHHVQLFSTLVIMTWGYLTQSHHVIH